jgi:cytidine deaminase
MFSMVQLTSEEQSFIERVKQIKYPSREQHCRVFILSDKNEIYQGTAFEALNWIHAEQVAIGSMLTLEPKSKFKLMLILGEPNIVMPCGMCRAAIFRYGVLSAPILCSNRSITKVERYSISELYPNPYIEK